MELLIATFVLAVLFILAKPGGKKSRKKTSWKWFSKSEPSKKRSESWYEKPAWKRIRDRRRAENNKRHGLGKSKTGALILKCARCGVVGTGHQVDHVKPRSTHPHLALKYDNTQVLCSVRSKSLSGRKCFGCNQKKSNKKGPNWRKIRELPGGAVIAFYLRNKQVREGKR